MLKHITHIERRSMSSSNDLSLNIQRFVKEDNRKRSASAISLDAGLSRDFIRNIINERSKNPSKKNLEALAKTLGKELDELLGPARAAEVKERTDNVLERKRESMKMTDLLVSFHEEIHGADSHCLLLKNEDIYRTIVNLRNSSKTVKRAEKITLEPLKTRFKSMALDTEIKVIRGKRRLVSNDGSGVWRITTASGGILHLGKVNLAKSQHFEFLVGTEKDIIDLKTIISTGSNKLVINPPKKGVWNAASSYIGGSYVHHYIRWKLDKENAKRFDTHPVYDKMKESIEDFFANIERWTRLGGSGTRKFLMYGPPGTGKTQMLSCLAANLSEDIFVVRVSDREEMMETARAVAKRKRKTFIICEELDAIKRGCSGDILNFLDGADTPRNVEGTFIVFTTNYPQEIDPRILKRPGVSTNQ